MATIKLVLHSSTTIFSDLILDWRDKAENSPPSKNASKREKREGEREREAGREREGGRKKERGREGQFSVEEAGGRLQAVTGLFAPS